MSLRINDFGKRYGSHGGRFADKTSKTKHCGEKKVKAKRLRWGEAE